MPKPRRRRGGSTYQRDSKSSARKSARVEEEDITSMYTPITNDVNVMKSLLEQETAQGTLDQASFDLFTNWFGECIWYQSTVNAQFSTSSNSNRRLSNSFHTLTNVLYRKDIKPDHPTKLPLCENTQENEELRARVYENIIVFLVDVLKMIPEDEEFVEIYSLLYQEETGMSKHPDSDKKIGKKSFSMRLGISVGASRKVEFSGMEFKVNDPQDNGRVVEGLDFTIETNKCADIYLTSPFASGRKNLCYTNNEKTTRVEAWHKVERIDSSCDGCFTMIVDFQLRSLEAKDAALNAMRGRACKICTK